MGWSQKGSSATIHDIGFASPAPGLSVWGVASDLISHKVFLKSFCKSQFPHKSVNLFFILVIMKDELTDLWGVDFATIHNIGFASPASGLSV